MSTKQKDGVGQAEVEIIPPGRYHVPASIVPAPRPRRRWAAALIFAAAIFVAALSLLEKREGPDLTPGAEIAAASMLGPAMGRPSSGGVVYIKVATLSSASDNWSVPSDALGPCVIEAWGPGGNGGTGTVDTNGAAGGGSGALGIHTTQTCTAGASIAYTVGQSSGNSTTILGGTAGSGGNASGNTAGTGGTASGFDTSVSGSSGGTSSSQFQTNGTSFGNSGTAGTNASPSNGGIGGLCYSHTSAGVRAYCGGGGGGPPAWSLNPFGAGRGGDGGTGMTPANVSDAGRAGLAPGGGGGGGGVGGSASSGGAGAAGRIRITYLASTP